MADKNLKIVLTAQDHTRAAFDSAKRSVQGFNSVLGMLGVGLSAAGFVAIIKGAIDTADHLGDLSKSTGIAVEQLAGLKLASEQSGAELDGVAASINKLSVNIGKDADKFARLGITAREPLEAFKQLADVFVAIKDPQQRAAFAAEALGRSWATAVPLLAEGGDAIGRMVDKGTKLSGITTEMTREADKFNDLMAEMKTSASGFGVAIGNDILPQMNTFLQQLIEGRRIFGSFTAAMFTAGTMDPFKSSGEYVKDLQADIETLSAMRERYLKSDSDTSRVDDSLVLLKKKLEWAKYIQRQEALAMLPAGGYRDEGARGLPTTPTKPAVDVSKFIGGPAADAGAREQDKRYKDHLAFFEERRKAEARAAADDHQQIQRWNDLADPAAKYREEIEDIIFSMSEVGGVSKEVGEANIKMLQEQVLETGKAAKEMDKTWEQFIVNVQSNLGDVLYNNLNGKFQDIGDLFKQMLLRMAADAAAANLTQSLFGGMKGFSGIGTLLGMNGGMVDPVTGLTEPSFAGGGFTGYGSRSGGIDGKGGFPAILHPNETVIDHAKGQGMGRTINLTYAPVTNVDARSDITQVQQIAEASARRNSAELVDRLQRQGAL